MSAQKKRPLRELPRRLLTAFVGGSLVMTAIGWLPSSLLLWIMLGFLALAAWEWVQLSGYDALRVRSAYVAAVVMSIALLGWLMPQGPSKHVPLIVFLAVLSYVACAFSMPYYPTYHGKSLGWLRAAWGLLVLPAVWLSIAMILSYHADGSGRGWLAFMMIVVWLADSAAYLVGSRYGRHRLAPRISPGKTWEGAAGALCAALLVTLAAAPWLTPKRGWLLGWVLVTVAFSVVGDLAESMLKRLSGVKDSGRFFPGHGGVLDRLDSFIAAAPVFVLGLYYFEF